MKGVYLTRYRTLTVRDLLAACVGNVRSAWRAGNGRDCLDEAEAPTIGHIGRIGERVGSSGGGRVYGPRRAGSVRSLRCSVTRSLAPVPLYWGLPIARETGDPDALARNHAWLGPESANSIRTMLASHDDCVRVLSYPSQRGRGPMLRAQEWQRTRRGIQ